MTLMHYRPWQLFDDFDREVTRLARTDSADTWSPAVDIQEEEGRYLVHADIPGVDPEAIDVSVDKGVLTIKGERQQASETEENGFRRVERRYGNFVRSFTLPESVDTDAIEATGENGVLSVSIPKTPELQPRRIEVKH